MRKLMQVAALVVLATSIWLAGGWLWQVVNGADLTTVGLWRNIKELFGPLSTTIALITFGLGVRNQRRSIRVQRAEQTGGVLRRYNDAIRKVVNEVVENAHELALADRKISRNRKLNEEQKINARMWVAHRFGLLDALHLVDEMGFYFRYAEHLNEPEMYAAVASELSRFLLNPELQPLIAMAINESSMTNALMLQTLLAIAGGYQYGRKKH